MAECEIIFLIIPGALDEQRATSKGFQQARPIVR